MDCVQCPSCSAPTRTLETRAAEDGGAVRRRRECRGCGRRFTSLERRVSDPAWVLKRGGERRPFDRTKLRAGLIRATHKRPVSDHDVEALVNRIEAECGRAGGELAAERIAELSLEGLSELDAGAYLQFAGVELADPDAIREALARLESGEGINPANREKTAAAFRPSRRAGSGVTPKRRQRGDG